MISEEVIKDILKKKILALVNGIIEAMPVLPQAIYLVGGYGRGEGAWYEDMFGIHPFNDFDLAVITDRPLSDEKTEILRKELAKEVGIRWVDIDYYTLDYLKNMKPSIHNVDLLEGGLLIYGEDVIAHNKISLNAQEIDSSDILTLYWTRMWTFLGSWNGMFHNLNIEEARFYKNQMAKGLLAACDMRLVKLHKYTTSYREKANLIMKEFASEKIFCELVSWAIREKMRPSNCEMGSIEMQKLYYRVKEEFIKSFDYSFGKNAHYLLHPNETKTYYLWHSKLYLFHFFSLIRYHKSKVLKRLEIFYAMNYIFHANNYGQIDIIMLEEASKLLMKHGYIDYHNRSWDELRQLVANARNNI